jgi:hypothetical protein
MAILLMDITASMFRPEVGILDVDEGLFLKRLVWSGLHYEHIILTWDFY